MPFNKPRLTAPRAHGAAERAAALIIARAANGFIYNRSTIDPVTIGSIQTSLFELRSLETKQPG